MGLQRLLHLAFPPQCATCDASVEAPFSLCGACWRETPFIQGAACYLCGTPLLGDVEDGETALCEECHVLARPWSTGRAAVVYRGNGRRVVLSLKHGDRLDLVPLAARWMAKCGVGFIDLDTVLVPIPAHRWRLAQRRYNQAALLSQAVGKITGTPSIPDLLQRPHWTKSQDKGTSVETRFQNLQGAIVPAKSARPFLAGRKVVLVDDVMTTGATFAAASEAAFAAGAAEVRVLALARAVKEA